MTRKHLATPQAKWVTWMDRDGPEENGTAGACGDAGDLLAGAGAGSLLCCVWKRSMGCTPMIRFLHEIILRGGGETSG